MDRRDGTTYCRLCGSACGIIVTIEDGRPTKVIGDMDHPLSAGFTCAKGRKLPEQHTHPDRLLHSLERRPDGSFAPIGWVEAADAIGDRLASIISEHGPRAVALYNGTAVARHPVSSAVGAALLRAIGSPMFFTPGSIDQPGKPAATSLHGRWGGGVQPLDEADVWLLVGCNPFVSKWSGSSLVNPARSVREGKRRGMKLVVIDPRVTETASVADLHLRPRPGQDAVLLAGIIRSILDDNLEDAAFCAADVKGLDELRAAVVPFTPEVVAARTGVSEAEQAATLDLLSRSRTGVIGSGTGLSMNAHGLLGEYLVLVLQTVLGFWRRAGERPVNPGMLAPQRPPQAQAIPQPPAWGVGEPSRIRGLTMGPAGMPTATLPDEILLDGPGQVRALLNVGGNPVNAWPNQLKTNAAMEKLELLVCFDPILNETARLAHFVIAPKLTMETASYTNVNDQIPYLGAGSIGFPVPFAMYAPAIVEPPEGSDVVQEYSVYFAIARRLGLTLQIGALEYSGGPDPTDDDLLEALIADAPVALSELKQFPHGAVFDDRVHPVEPADDDRADDVRLDVGHPLMMAQLDALALSVDVAERGPDASRHTLQLIVRRTPNCTNSSDRHISHGDRLPRFNPAFVNPLDAVALGIETGDPIEISTPVAAIRGIVEVADDVLVGTLSMAHGYGDLPDRDNLARSIGAPTNRLIDDEVAYDPYLGIPVMTGFEVGIRKLPPLNSPAPEDDRS